MVVIAKNFNDSWLKNSGYSIEEEWEIYYYCLKDVYDNPRWYLDNLDRLPVFRVRFLNYSKPNTKHL